MLIFTNQSIFDNSTQRFRVKELSKTVDKTLDTSMNSHFENYKYVHK